MTACATGKQSLGYRQAHELIAWAHHNHIGAKKIPQRAYYCAECGLWHVTSDKRRRAS